MMTKIEQKNMSDKELRELAISLYKGEIFTDRHLRKNDNIGSTFVPLMLLDQETIDDWKTNPPGLIYEFMKKASPIGINGNPIFFSMRLLTVEDTKKLFEYHENIIKTIDILCQK